MPAARGSFFWQIDEALAKSGTDNFANEYKAILDFIYELNPRVTVISSTLYNPYNSAKLPHPLGIRNDTNYLWASFCNFCVHLWVMFLQVIISFFC
jgi:hypothetical protein